MTVIDGLAGIARTGFAAAGRRVNLGALRSLLFTLAGLGALSYAAYQWHHAVGWAVGGISLLLLDHLTTPPGDHRIGR
jgi:hypothetical protein